MSKRRKQQQRQRQPLQQEHRYYQPTNAQSPQPTRPRRKKIRLRARFYTIVATLVMLIIGLFFLRSTNTNLPNLHGWESNAVVQFAREHGIDVEFEFSYSTDVAPTLVIGQSVAPGTNLDEVDALIIEVSKGIEVQ